MPELRPLGVAEDGPPHRGGVLAASAASADSAAGGLRAELLTGIQRHRAAFAAAGDEAESLRTLPPDAVATLRSLGLFWLKTPASLGGHAVAGIPHPVLGEDVAAWIVRRPGAEIDAGGLQAFLAERLTDYKIPRRITFVAELPRNATGKVVKHLLMDLPS